MADDLGGFAALYGATMVRRMRSRGLVPEKAGKGGA